MKVIEIEGNADDLFNIDCNGQVQCISAVKLHDNNDINDEPCDLDITLTSFSVDGSCNHKTVDKALGHKIRFTLEVID